jgi:protoheme IX farnesyltransferase
MAAGPMLSARVYVVPSRSFATVAVVAADYWAITKPEISFLIAVTTSAAFMLAERGVSTASWIPLLHAVLGTALVSAGAGALNQAMEHRFDAGMRRTARRPIAAGRIQPAHGVLFGIVLALAGIGYLAVAANGVAALLAAGTLVTYLLIYTPLKRITPLCTLVGATPGAAPPLIGWAAARGHLDPEAWLLFTIVLLWQFPHFMAIAWMYRDDYDRAGYRVLPDDHGRAAFVDLHVLVPLAALLVVSLIPVWLGVSERFYLAGALLLNLGFLASGVQFVRRKSGSSARKLLVASICFLPLFFLLLVVCSAVR